MKTMNTSGSILALVGALTLGACATTNTQPYNPAGGISGPDRAYYRYGVVQSIELVKQGGSGTTGSNIGIGTVAGAVVGGVLGSQVGAGRGNTAATVIGAAGGAYVGHEMEKRQQQQQVDGYKITVRMDDGSYQALMQNADVGYRVGDRVRIDNNGVLQRY